MAKCFIKAAGMKRVRCFPSHRSALIYVALNHAKWPSRIVLAGSGHAVSARGQKNPDYHSKMQAFTVEQLLHEIFHTAIVEARMERKGLR
jgi:hypothetical protein